MGKTIRKTIQITTRKRHNGVKINEEFYSYDKNNAQFEFLMDYDVPADKVIALFHFENTNRYYETLCRFKGNLITIEFDTSLIVEDELVTGYLYFDKLETSTDVYRFTFGARLSEIDKTRELPVQEKVSHRIVPVTDIVTKQELKELLDRIQKNGGTYDDTEIRQSISSISERVKTLESKPDNDSDVKSRLNALESNASKYLTEHQPLTSIEERIQKVEARFNNLSNIYLSSHQSLEHLATKDALGKIEQRVEQLENKPTIDTNEFARKSEIPQSYNDKPLLDKINEIEEKSKLYLQSHQSLEHLVTRKELEDKHYLTSIPEEITNKISALENKSVVTHEELESEGYLKEHQPLTDYATNSKVEAVESRVLALENNHVTHDSTGLDETQFVSPAELEAKHYLTETQAESVYAKKTDVPNTTNFATTDSVNNLLRTQGEQASKISALESKSAYEIHGTGMPNGQIEAPIGTTYVDMAVTNGALKWIKHSGNGNTGWKVLIGDTGWRTLNSVSRLGNSFIKIRRVNNLVTYNFGGLQWGWFGVGRRNGPGFVRHNSSGDKGAKLTYPNGIPEGFRSENSLVGPIYDDKGKPYGIWYLGGKSDLNFIQFTFNDPIPTDKDIGDIRVSAISYVTDEDWPTTLP